MSASAHVAATLLLFLVYYPWVASVYIHMLMKMVGVEG